MRRSINAPTVSTSGELIGDDALVVDACRDRQAFTLLYERYATRVYRYARARTGSDDVAEDVLSATMLNAMERIDRFDPARGTFATWLFTIATRRLADQHRAHGRLHQLARRLWQPEGSSDDALTSTILHDDVDHLRRAMDRLSDRDRDLVLLRYHAELSSAEIGQLLNMSAVNVRVRLTRVLRRLADDLENTQ